MREFTLYFEFCNFGEQVQEKERQTGCMNHRWIHLDVQILMQEDRMFNVHDGKQICHLSIKID